MFLIGIMLLLFFFMLRSSKGESPAYADGPKLTYDQQRANYKSVRNFIEAHPGYEINNRFPEYREDIAIAKAYNDLNARHAKGEISDADYQIELYGLSKQIKMPLSELFHVKKYL